MKKIKFGLLFAIILTVAAAATAWAKIPDAVGYANDFANVLEAETISHIDELSGNLDDSTGAQLVVATVYATDGLATGDYSLDMFNQWKLGAKGLDNGVLLLLAIGTDDYYIIVGDGFGTGFTATLLNIVRNTLEDDFAAARYDEGVRATYDKLYAEIKAVSAPLAQSPNSGVGSNANSGYDGGYYDPEPDYGITPGTRFLSTIFFFVFVIGIIVIVIVAMAYSGGRRYYGPGAPPVVVVPWYRRWFYPRHYHHHRPHYAHRPVHRGYGHPAPPPARPGAQSRPPSGGGRVGGGFSGGGGISRGSGGGRTSGLGGGGPRPGGGFGGGGGRGGGFSGGGGMSRGGGGGRR